jgi:hypothetical protein
MYAWCPQAIMARQACLLALFGIVAASEMGLAHAQGALR